MNNNKINIYKQARLAYLLSSCHILSNIIFVNIIKQYQGQNLVAIRSNFKVYLNFKNNNTVFTMNRLSCKFLDLTKYEFIKLFCPHIKEGHDHNRHNCTIWHIKELITQFKNHKYIMIPATIDYGIPDTMNHQAMLIIDMQDKIFMFYEPYGKYSKFNMSYDNAVLNLFKENIGNEFKYTTYHKYYNLDQGIQTILLEQNNAKPNFKRDLENITKNKIHLYKNYLVDPVDKTIECMNVIENAEKNIISDNETYKKALELYYNYNSKTCVSITLVEMNNFLSIASKNNSNVSKSILDISKSILYTYNTTNEKLMQEIYDLTIKFAKYNKLDKFLNNTTIDPKFICDQFFIHKK
jgi:hypothetical protein